MKSKHLKKIFFIGVLICLFTITTVEANTRYTLDFKNETKTIKYGEPFSVEISGVNQLDYDYSVSIDYELPKPQTLNGPGLPENMSGFQSFFPTGITYKVDPLQSLIVELNNFLKVRLTKFGRKEIDAWFKELVAKLVILTDKGKEEDINKIIATTADKKDEAASLIIEENDIVTAMLKTKPGGALIITITTKAKKWEIGMDGKFISKGEIVEKIDDLGLTPGQKEDVADHIKTKIIRFEFEGPKGITFSVGPYVSLFLNRYEYGRVKNPNFKEGSTDVKYYIDYTEDSKNIYGIASFWNAPILEETFGVCWGVAYNLQKKLENGISGLAGFYYRPRKSVTMINFGAAIGPVQELAAGYEINKTPIGENEEIPLKTKIKIGAFISISFKM